jgi:carbamoyltransferase
MFEFEDEGLEIALKFFDSLADVAALQNRLSEVRGVARVNWRQGELTIVSETEVVKLHLKEQEINERHGLKDRLYLQPSATSGEVAVKIYHRDSRDDIKERNKPVYILGVVRNSHDSGAALVKDGILIGAIEEERLNLNKHTVAYFPKESTRYLLEDHGITWEDIDHIALTYDYNFFRQTPHSPAPNLDFRREYNLPFSASGTDQRYDTDQLQSFLEELAVGYGTEHIPPVTFVKHHKTHAVSAYYASGFAEPTLVVTIDGQGEDESTTVWLGKEGILTKIARTIPFTHSLGHFYHIITVYLGYRRHDEGKVMGFAPYGAPRNPKEESAVSQLRKMMQELIWFNRETGQIRMNQEHFNFTLVRALPGICFSESFLRRLEKVVPPMPEGKTGRDLTPEDREMAHLAFAAQERSEQVINDMVSYYLNEYDETKGVKHVVMAGGLALNIVANGKLIQSGTVKADKFFVPAYPADDGTSVGAALSVAYEEYELDVHNEVKKISLGKTYSDEEIQSVLDRFRLTEGVDYEHVEGDEQLVEKIADAIAGDETVAWFQGGAELGPRALGNRSILNRLNDPEGNLKVNRIKNREPWRPSALSIQQERASEFLEGICTSPFMTIAFPVREEKRGVIRAGVHPVDGTTRPQTVSHDANPLYWSLLGELGERTGVPGVLNTSFNRWGPIVETPEGAINTYFYGQGLDILAIGHFIVRRRDKIVPSVLHGRDEDSMKYIFAGGTYEPLSEQWNEFWTEANRLVAARKSSNQHFVIFNLADTGECREILRVPLVKEMFQKGQRENMILDLAARIQGGIGRDVPVTVSIETTVQEFREVIVDLFRKFSPDYAIRNWNIVG